MTRLIPASLALVLACALPLAAEPFSVDVGGPDGPRATFVFDPDAQPQKIVIRTDEAGVTGSRLRVRIDRAPSPAWEHVFREGECRFPEGRPSVCEIAISEDDPSFR